MQVSSSKDPNPLKFFLNFFYGIILALGSPASTTFLFGGAGGFGSGDRRYWFCKLRSVHPRDLHHPSDSPEPKNNGPRSGAISRGSGFWTGPWPDPRNHSLTLGGKTGSSTRRPRTPVRLQRGLAECTGFRRSQPWLSGGRLGAGRHRSGCDRNSYDTITNSLHWSVRRDPGKICLISKRLNTLFLVDHISKRRTWRKHSWRGLRLSDSVASGKEMRFCNATVLNLLLLLLDRTIFIRGNLRTFAVGAYRGSITLLSLFIFPTSLTHCCCFTMLACVANLLQLKHLNRLGTNRSTFTFNYPTLISLACEVGWTSDTGCW